MQFVIWLRMFIMIKFFNLFKKKKKEVYVHIGMPKTGTTTLQNYLSAEYVNLEKYSILYPNSGRENCVGHHILTALELDEYTLEYSKKQYQKLIDEIEKSKCKKVIISSETYSGLKRDYLLIDDLSNYLGEKYDIKIIIYIREHIDFIKSYYMQRLKGGRKIFENSFLGDIEDFYKKNKDYFNYFKRIQYLETKFGKNNLMIRVYDKKLLDDGDIIKDFLNILKIDFKKSTEIKNDNSSIDYIFANLIQLYDSAFINVLHERGSDLFIKRRQNIINPLIKASLLIKNKDISSILEILKNVIEYIEPQINKSLFEQIEQEIYRIKNCLEKFNYIDIEDEIKQEILQTYKDSNFEFANRYLKKEEKNIFLKRYI